MAITYYLSGTDSDLGGGTDFNRILSLDTGTPGTIAIPIAKEATQTSYGFTASLSSAGIQGTSTGTFTIKVNVTTGLADVFGSISLSRLSSTGTVLATSAATAEQELTAGVKTFSLVNPDLGTWGTTDRLRANYIFRNALKKGVDIDIGTNTNDESVDTPFTIIYNRFSGYFWD